MTIFLVVFILVLLIAVVAGFLVSKVGNNGQGVKRKQKTEDLSSAYQTPVRDGSGNAAAPKLNTGGRRGTEVLEPESDQAQPIVHKSKKGGTEVLRPEDDPQQGGKPKETVISGHGKRGTEVLKEDMIPDNSSGPAASSAPSKKSADKALPTVLLEDIPQEETGNGLFQKRKKHQTAILEQKRTKTRIEISDDELKIGREKSDVDLCIEDNLSVSRHHATISRKGDGFYISDHGSMNFTFVNNYKLKPETPVKLKNKDSIVLGDEVFTFIIR